MCAELSQSWQAALETPDDYMQVASVLDKMFTFHKSVMGVMVS